MLQKPVVEKVLADYSNLEPDQSDSWSPVGSKYQLAYRLNLYYSLARALQHVECPIEDLQVLDLGCGNGRSTRMYLDMGLHPEQLHGVDLRAGAIARARRLNPAIRWDLYDGGALPLGHNWLAATCVFSSVATREARETMVGQINDSLPLGGYVFYYDVRRANPFAGGDWIEPQRLFAAFRVVWSHRLGRFSTVPAKDRRQGLMAGRLRGDDRTVSLREMIGDIVAPSQDVLLMRKA